MSPSKRILSAAGAALAIGVGASTLVFAQWTPFHNNPGSFMKSFTDNWSSKSNDAIGQLASNEGIYVDTKDFKIAKGSAKGDPSAQISKLGARAVSEGAIIFRSGDKLYIVDGTPPKQ
jgi:hypothetical protein